MTQFIVPVFCAPYNHLATMLHQHSAPLSHAGRVVPVPCIMTKLRYCDITGRSDIVTEQERSRAIIYTTSSFLTLQEKLRQFVLLRFRQEDFGHNLDETSFSPWLLESVSYAHFPIQGAVRGNVCDAPLNGAPLIPE